MYVRTDPIYLVESFNLDSSATYAGGFDIGSSSFVVVSLPNMMIMLLKLNWCGSRSLY